MSDSLERIVGPSLARVMPKHEKWWPLVPHLLKLNLMLLVPLLSSATAGYDGSLMNGLQSLDEWKSYFHNPQGSLLGFVNAAQSAGSVIILPLCGWMADNIGRKLTLAIGLLIIIIATIIQATSTTLAQLIVSRFVVGAGGMLSAQPAPMWIAELSYPSHRGKLTSLYWCFYYLGAILASWATYGVNGRGDTWAWRIPTILQAGYPFIQLVAIMFVPESPRYLVSKGKMEKARQILVNCHAGGDQSSELVEVEMTEILTSIEAEKVSEESRWRDLVSTAGNRRRTYIALTLGISAQWNGVAVVSYYLTLVLDTIGITKSSMQTLINGLLQIFNFIAAASGAVLVDRMGRRTLFLWSGLGMLISYVVWTICSALFDIHGTNGAGISVVVFIFVYYFHYDIAYTPLLLGYPTEIFPFYIRSKGITVELIGVYCALILAAFVNPIALDNIGWKYYIVFCVLLLFIFLNTYFFYPETRGYSLEEISRVFDGDEAVIQVEDDQQKGAVITHIESV
uniref:ARAD1C00242p n=1 Tax=Blastobotrys adeninivorans TaxID=409370 RepID=A0A060SZF0_BLAAD